ncbi:Kdo domain containing protein [Winogradskyella sp. DF17]|uniref:Kdo domain containing protein n=1 Tax=Winogradskyella pelagia TaxID=2819984 RepID=A0ABS3T0C4_9FLAO|nr:lipopolysaccharide kinase InaA family protein [Winogradskyella sp. DF17]MBO3116191.1 Kdo domain containing protein [Winogradskyella sp. DF17]
MQNKQIYINYKPNEERLDYIVNNFDNEGENFGNQDRNQLKLFKVNDITANIKSFRVPNFINQVAYRFFRKSKAQRSYEYALRLLKLGIGTPQPVAFYEYVTSCLFKKSYYISEHLSYDLTYRELTLDLNYPNHEEILRAFTRFTYHLHEKGVHFLDHSPGNTLIKTKNNKYSFYLVDLNRMEFKTLDFETRIKNFSKLTVHKSMIEIMSDEYAKCCNEDYNRVFELMWSSTKKFQQKYWRKIKLKKKLKFWKR